MQEYRYLLDIALILLMTKAFGLFSRRLRMPSVVGALIAGIVLGPAVLNIVEPSKLIESLSEIGVGLLPVPINAVTPGVVRTRIQVLSVSIIFTKM